MERKITEGLTHVENEDMVEKKVVGRRPVGFVGMGYGSGHGGHIVPKGLPWVVLEGALFSGDLSTVTSVLNGDVSFIPPFPSHPPESGVLRHLLWWTQRFALIALV